MAPAGFGKTVALRDFIDTSRLDVVRYDVRREDTTLISFVRGLSGALRTIAPSLRASFPVLQASLLTSDDQVHQLADWFSEHLKRTVATVAIDDLHYAAADPATIPLLVELIERTTGRINWIIATRSDAGLPVASWLGYGRIDLPIGEDDLRFTRGEALAAASESMAAIEPNEVESLREFTEGWPVALTIALRTRTHASDLRSASVGTREMVYRYLAEQVFSALDDEQQRFLLNSCAFPGFDLALAQRLGASVAFLSDLRRSVTFLYEMAPGQYRYHELFREFLEMQLRRAGEQAWVNALSCAGALLEERGNDLDALALYVRAKDQAAITALLERGGLPLFERGQGELLTSALQLIDERERSEAPSLLGLGAMLEAARGHFEIAERSFVAAIDRAAGSDVQYTLVHRFAIELVRNERDCIELLEPYAGDATIPAAVRVPMLGTLATAYVRARRIDDALGTIARGLALIDGPLDDDVRARFYQQAAFVHQFAPERGHAWTYASLAVELALANNLYDVAARAYSALYTIVCDDDDDPIESLAILDRLIECARKGASLQAELFGLLVSFDLEVERGDDAAIERLERALEESRVSLPQTRAEALVTALALRASWEGDFARAYTLLAGTAQTQGTPERCALRNAEIALYAFAAGAHDAGDEAISEMQRALSRCDVRTRRAQRAMLWASLAELVRGHAAAAFRYLHDAERYPMTKRLRSLAYAVRTMYRVQLEQEEQASIAGALERLRAEHFGGIARLLAKLPFPSGGERGSFAVLTAAEREILALLARGASTKEVAASTGRSPHTVDTHIRSICRKLQCSGRREAVALAVGEGWVETVLREVE